MVGAQVRPIERTAEGALKPRAAAEAKSIVMVSAEFGAIKRFKTSAGDFA